MSLTPEKKPSLWEVIKSVLAALIGVQSDKARQRDFTTGNPWAYIWVGIIAVVVLVLSILIVVKIVLAGVKV